MKSLFDPVTSPTSTSTSTSAEFAAPRGTWASALPAATLLMGLSGFAGLGYQIVWTEQLGIWLGHDIVAVLAVVAAFFGGLIGMIAFSLPGLLVGALAAMVIVEFFEGKDWRDIFRAGTGYLIGYLISMAVELLVCLLMIGIFLLAIRF